MILVFKMIQNPIFLLFKWNHYIVYLETILVALLTKQLLEAKEIGLK